MRPMRFDFTAALGAIPGAVTRATLAQATTPARRAPAKASSTAPKAGGRKGTGHDFANLAPVKASGKAPKAAARKAAKPRAKAEAFDVAARMRQPLGMAKAPNAPGRMARRMARLVRQLEARR